MPPGRRDCGARASSTCSPARARWVWRPCRAARISVCSSRPTPPPAARSATISRPWPPDGALFGRSRIHRRDATDLGKKPAGDGAPFDLAFLDPPYARGLGERALASLAQDGWLKVGAICVFERGADEPAPPSPASRAWTIAATGRRACMC